MKNNDLFVPEIECLDCLAEKFFVYLLQCSGSSFYCGSTNELKNRLAEHNQGEAALWTRKRRPDKLIYYETADSLLLARRREKQIKGWTRIKKLNLINGIWEKI